MYEMKESNQGSAVCVLAVVVVVDVGISHAIGIELEAAYVNILSLPVGVATVTVVICWQDWILEQAPSGDSPESIRRAVPKF